MSEVPKKETALEEDMDSVPLDNENRDPTPKLVPEPNPNPSAAVSKPESVVNARDVDVNVKDIPSADVEDKKLNKSSEESVTEQPVHRVQYPNVYSSDHESSNPYVQQPSLSSSANSSSFNFKETMGSVKDVLGKWGKKVGEATKKAEDLAENTWQHLKTSPSLADAALGRIAQGTKVLAEGGYEKIFRQSFETVPDEQLRNSFACYLSTSAGPVMGVLYMSTEKLAFCSDNPLSYQTGDRTEWSYYKVVIPLHQLKAINPSTSRTKPAEKYIQVISVDNHEFWFMGFLNYTSAVECLQEALAARGTQSV